MRKCTDLALAARIDEARAVRDSLEPVRQSIRSTRPGGKPHAHQKYWQSLLGQVGGNPRFPMLPLTDAEKAVTRAAFEQCGLQVAPKLSRAV